MIELIILGLRRWHNDDPIPYSYDILEPTLLQAWRKQRCLGWKSFLEGFWALEWRLCQAQYLQFLNSQKSSTLWISRAQRRIWMIAWDMWSHRNKFLHNEGKTIHLFEMAALDDEIRNEWDASTGQLPSHFDHMSSGQLIHRLDDMIHHKLMWLFSVWSARDNEIHIGPLRTRNTTMTKLYDRWKSKNILEE
jgi:hypothetical protein